MNGGGTPNFEEDMHAFTQRNRLPGTSDQWELPPLTLADRCDFTCNAPALLRVVMHTGDLYACAHHYSKHETPLRAVAVHVQDARIQPRPDATIADFGRMNMRRGLTHADPCRHCTTRLTLKRLHVQLNRVTSEWRDYFICAVCDETAADMESLKGLSFDD